MSLSISTAVDRLVLRAVQEHWSNARLDAAIIRARELRADASTKSTGKPCGKSYIPKGNTCHKGGALTPASVTQTPRQGDWRRKAAIAAGITATGLAVGLPAASFLNSGTAPGRRNSMKIEGFTREAGKALMTWGAGPLAPNGIPLGMGAMAGAEGMRAGSMARRTVESWRAAPGFAKGAAGLASRKAKSAAARRSYIEAMKRAWASGQRPITPTEARRRAAQVRKVEEQIAQLNRQATTRSRAAGRSARIARTGAPWRDTPTASEVCLREGIQSPNPIRRAPASLSAGLLRSLQSTRSVLSERRPRSYRTRRDEMGEGRGKPCCASHIPKAPNCTKGQGISAKLLAPAGPRLTPAKVFVAAPMVGDARRAPTPGANGTAATSEISWAPGRSPWIGRASQSD